jgi:cytoskeletal protein CcmA (bactofilin family)
MWNREALPASDGMQQPHATPQSTAGRSVEDRRLDAWVGKSVIFRGDLISSEDMTIDGRVEGTIEVRDHRLTIGPNANIEADIVAKSVTIFGKVTGSVTGQDKVEIRLSATVEADVACASLAIQEGAQFCGKVAMTARSPQTQAATAKPVSAPPAAVAVMTQEDTSHLWEGPASCALDPAQPQA